MTGGLGSEECRPLVTRPAPLPAASCEFDRSQRRNNNGDCQDNEIIWLSGNPIAEDVDFVLLKTGGHGWQMELTTFDLEGRGNIAEEGKAFPVGGALPSAVQARLIVEIIPARRAAALRNHRAARQRRFVGQR